MRHVLSLFDLSAAEVDRVFSITEDLKTKYNEGLREALLPGRVTALLFEKPSLRTRVSFEAGMTNLGGSSLFLGDDVGFGKRETISDFSRVLSSFVDALVVRARDHETVAAIADAATCSVINGLTDKFHPCQALADLFTLRELVGKLRGHTLAYVGDANNVAKSLAIGCGKVGVRMTIASPQGYEFDDEFRAQLAKDVPELELLVTNDPVEAVDDATAVYTDVWTSMGQEAETAERKRIFADYQVNAELMSHAAAGAYFMHCLPAHRGEEVTAEVIDGPTSVVVQEANNRMHVQKGLLVWLLGAMT
jgi:ornithine carbamoyltransferase